MEIKYAVFLNISRYNDVSKKYEVLLHKRCGVDYYSNCFDFAASGHINDGEEVVDAVIRKAYEELGIIVLPADVEFYGSYFSPIDNYMGYVFNCINYRGTPKIMEEDKSSALEWFDIDKMPGNAIPLIPGIINDMKNDGVFVYPSRKLIRK